MGRQDVEDAAGGWRFSASTRLGATARTRGLASFASRCQAASAWHVPASPSLPGRGTPRRPS